MNSNPAPHSGKRKATSIPTSGLKKPKAANAVSLPFHLYLSSFSLWTVVPLLFSINLHARTGT